MGSSESSVENFQIIPWYGFWTSWLASFSPSQLPLESLTPSSSALGQCHPDCLPQHPSGLQKAYHPCPSKRQKGRCCHCPTRASPLLQAAPVVVRHPRLCLRSPGVSAARHGWGGCVSDTRLPCWEQLHPWVVLLRSISTALRTGKGRDITVLPTVTNSLPGSLPNESGCFSYVGVGCEGWPPVWWLLSSSVVSPCL